MPTPTATETEQEFIGRCIPIVLADGTTDDNRQAVAICYSMWREGRKTFTVYKSRDGSARWLSISSTAYIDRDGEIVSRKSLEQAVAFNDRRGYYGPLRWWHVGDIERESLKAGAGLDIGDCDFSMLYGKFLLESGTFRKPEYANALKSFDGQISIGFLHPAAEPDDEGVYHNIVIVERSLTPTGKASNPFTSFLTIEERRDMADKVKEFVDLLGDQEFAAGVIEQLDARQAELDAAGVASKSAEDDADAGWIEKLKNLINPPAEPEPEPPKATEKAAVELTAETIQAIADAVGAAVAATLADAAAELDAEAESAVLDDTRKAERAALENALQRIGALEEQLKATRGEIADILGAPGVRPTESDDNVIGEKSAIADGLVDFINRIGGK